jgi:8-oxo-dGTP pyrophosphatase MutT (NUDIX family)
MSMTTYYNNLRQPVEKPDDVDVRWRPCVYGILSNEKGEWFMVEPTWAEQWDLPGGGTDIDESIREALVREFYEETGFKVEVVGDPLYLGESRLSLGDRGFFHSIILIFKVKLVDEKRDEHVVNTFDDGFEIREGRWIDPSSIIENDVHPIYWPFIQKWQKDHF